MKNSLFAELKRRHVYRVAVAYAVVGWLLVEVASQLFPFFRIPNWSIRLLVFFVVAGFPIALVLAWAFELTPEGVRRTEPADSPDARPSEQHRQVGRTLDFVIIGVLVVAVGIMAWRLRNSRTAMPPASTTAAQRSTPAPTAAETPAPATAPVPATTGVTPKSVAVLPFENLSTDKGNGYFADGMQDLILTKLADIGDLKVISRTSTMQYGSHPQNLKKIGLELGVAALLEGSVQKAGNSVLINVQLIDAQTDAHIWAQSYTRTLDNVFGVEGEVAGRIATALKAKLSPAETKRLAVALSPDASANDLFLRGEYFANRGIIDYDTTAFKQAIAFYRQAIARVADFSQARARLSYAEDALAWFGGGGENVAPLIADARQQAEKALKLSPDLADAHLALGYYDYWGKGDYAAALDAFDAALALRPNDSGTLAAQGYVLRRQGRFDDAIEKLKKAMALDPRNTSPAFETATTYMQASRFLQAEKGLQRALALDPANVNARRYYGQAILFRSGDVAGALAETQGNDPLTKVQRVKLLTYERKYSEALTLLQSIPDTPDAFLFGNGGPKALQLAYLYGLSGDSAKARALYAKALPEARAQHAALTGSPINQDVAMVNVAQAEIGMDRTRAGLADAAKVQALGERSDDHMYGPGLMRHCAALYAQAGRADKAVPVLSAALNAPGIGWDYSPVMLWLDPVWDPIRKSPRFQALLKKYAKDRPAVVPDESRQTVEAHAGAS